MKSSAYCSKYLVGEELLNTIAHTKIIVDFMDKKILPSVDSLLDRRLVIDNLYKDGLIDEHWMRAEIIAVDFLLNKHRL